MIVRRSRVLAVLAVLTASAAIASAACSSSAPSTDDSIRQYCSDLMASPAFSCCTSDDRAQRPFATRSGYASAADCTDQLVRAVAQSSGRRGFDSAAASSCLSYLGSRPCQALPTTAVRIAEEKAGCHRVVTGAQDEGKPCDASEDCVVGLVCPPVRDTGTSSCARPAAATQSCAGAGAGAGVDHPPCQPGLFCSAVGENTDGCPSPPCLDYRCVPFFEEGEPCTGAECGNGLLCTDGTCRRTAPSGQGGPCRLTEHCADGLYCDENDQCLPRKAAGQSCRGAGISNAAFECTGICSGDGPGVCVGFCSN